MKRNKCIRPIGALLAAVLLATLACSCHASGQGAGRRQQHATAVREQPQQLAASAAVPQGTRRAEAMLTDATSLYRVCGSRPQRILPTHGSKTDRTTTPCGFRRRTIVTPLHFLHDGRQRRETAPFCLSASCLYYVIALRHIIR